MTAASPQDSAAVRVIRGDAEPEELAALLVALTALSVSGPVAPAEPLASGWLDRGAGMRGPLAPSPDGWRASGRPG